MNVLELVLLRTEKEAKNSPSITMVVFALVAWQVKYAFVMAMGTSLVWTNLRAA